MVPNNEQNETIHFAYGIEFFSIYVYPFTKLNL